MSHDPSRKQFFAKLLGLTASLTVVAEFFAKSTPVPGPSNAPATPAAPVVPRPEPRAIARRADSV